MKSGYLLDTNTASYIIKGNIPAVRRRLVKIPMAQIAVSAVTEGELRYGVARLVGATRLQTVVNEFLLRVTVVPWGSEAAQHYGQLRATLEGEGRLMGSLDTMIGAHALALGFVLVTSDHSFARIKKLRIEDWTKP
jgi:tRNA(fMet)-specific endonuclease VapC